MEAQETIFDNSMILKNECLFVIDFHEKRLLQHKGIENILGYKDKEVSRNLLISIFHPDDREVALKVVKEAVLFILNDTSHGSDSMLFLKYRCKRKDGAYITVLSQSFFYKQEANGIKLKSVTRLTDISFAIDFPFVRYSFQAQNLDKTDFDKQIFKDHLQLFTNRELDVIHAIFKGLSNRQISERLRISEHTVATHRKNILRKAECHNSEELRFFCEGNGILKLNGNRQFVNE